MLTIKNIDKISMSKNLSNKGFKIVEGIIWTLAVVGMIGLLCALYELKGITKEVREYRSIVNRK
jgi:hypothetical protein